MENFKKFSVLKDTPTVATDHTTPIGAVPVVDKPPVKFFTIQYPETTFIQYVKLTDYRDMEKQFQARVKELEEEVEELRKFDER